MRFATHSLLNLLISWRKKVELTLEETYFYEVTFKWNNFGKELNYVLPGIFVSSK